MSVATFLQSAEIPVIHEVDVVVVGGTAGAVAAAEAAARAGASVFLAARRSYLGDDVAGTLALWDAGGEDPQGRLSQALFGARQGVVPYAHVLETLDGKDTGEAAGRQLNDGVWNSPELYAFTCRSGRVVRIDLQQARPLEAIRLYSHRAAAHPNNALTRVLVETSADGATWTEVAEYRNSPLKNPPVPTDAEGIWCYRLPFASAPVRHVRATILPNGALDRLTLLELVLEEKGASPKAPSVPRSELTPLNAKKFLDQALIDAGVRFMTGCYGTELLVDESGRPAGVVIANRSGRQAIKAKVVVDATPFGALARQAGATFSAFQPGPVNVSTVVITDKSPVAPGMTARAVMKPQDVNIGGRWGVKPADGSSDALTVSGYVCEAPLGLNDFSPFALAELEHGIRDKVFTFGQQEIAEMVRFAPPFRLQGAKSVAAWPVDGMPDVQAFRPAGLPGIYVLSGVADFAPAAANRLAVPANLMNAGQVVGMAAATEAAAKPAPRSVRVQGVQLSGLASPAYGEVRELLGGLLPNATTASGGVRIDPKASLPVLGECDVLVAGGGSSGSPAAIAAAREGVDVVLCEYHHDLGGTATVGVLGKYYPQDVVSIGFSVEIDKAVGAQAANINQGKGEWFRREARRRGVRVLTGTLVCGVTVRDNRVTGAVVATPDGRRGVILAKTVIDATGNADLAAAAGEPTQFIGSAELAIQGASMNDRPLGANTVNVDIGFVDDTDAWDLSFFPLRTRRTLGYNSVWDQSQHVDSRERRRLVGVCTVTAVDVLAERRFPDTVVQGLAPLDNHGQTTHPALALFNPTPANLKIGFPYRMMLPPKLDGLLVVGLGISADHDAIAAMRMQRDLQNLGYAAGVASAMGVKAGTPPRALDVRALQRKLVEAGMIGEDAANGTDSFPLPRAELEAAVRTIPDRGGNGQAGYRGLARLCSDPATAVELLKAAFAAADSDAKAMYAASLAAFGDATGASTLIAAVKGASAWDAGWQWSGPGAYARKHSDLDGYVLMLGRLRAREALPALVEKAALLTERSEFSHFRAIAMALEQLGDPNAAPALARLLALPGVRGHALPPFAEVGATPYASHSPGSGDVERRAALRELALARALYRLGDSDGEGETVLKAYAADPRSAYARHALLVLGTDSAASAAGR